MNEYKQELKKIYLLLKANDEETKVLGYNLFQNSKFRKYIRNKCFSIKHKRNEIFYKFPLYSLFPPRKKGEKDIFKTPIRQINEDRMIHVRSIISYYISGKMKIHNYSQFKNKVENEML